MKTIAGLLTLFMYFSAQASTQYSIHCSNAEGTVKWLESTSTNFIQFTSQEILTLDLKMVDIKFLDKVVIDHELENICGYYRAIDIFSGKVEIRPSSINSRDLTTVTQNNVVETSVICRKEIKTTFICRN